MENKFLIFRADGNAKTGLGHLYRIFALIEMFKLDFKYQLVVKDSSVLNIIPKDYNLNIISGDIDVSEEPQWLSENYNASDSIIIADGYEFTSIFQKCVKEKGFKLAYVDDLANEHMYADIVINHSPHIKESDFASEKYTQFALGTNYAILRPLFIEAAKKTRYISEIDTAFICFGGADSNNLTFKIVQGLLDSKLFKSLNIVIGAAYNHENIYKLASENKSVSVYKNLNEVELFTIISKCNFAVVPSSTILYEVCAIKMPVLSGYFVDNQMGIYKACIENGMIYGGGNLNQISTGRVNELVIGIADDEYSNYICSQQEMFDSKIKQRFLALLRDVKYRLANSNDIELLYNWANDGLVRQNSFNNNKIKWEDHVMWYNDYLNGNNTEIYIAESGSDPVGYVRFEEKDEVVISVLISEEFRGLGLSGRLIQECTLEYKERKNTHIIAYIKATNSPSLRSFTKSGYQIKEKVNINGVDSYKLINS